MFDPLQVSIGALEQLKDEFRTGYEQYPDLYYAVIRGEAVSNGGVGFPQADGTHRDLEDYLKEHIADGKPYAESVGWKHPRYFFFGDDLSDGLRRFASIAQTANKIIRDGLHAVRQVPGSGNDLNGGFLPEHWHLLGDNLYEHEWLFWMMYLGNTSGNPVLKSKREPIEAVADPLPSPLPNAKAPHPVFAHSILIQTIHGLIGFDLRRKDMGFVISPEQWKLLLPPWQAVLDAAKGGTLTGITIFDTSIFYASMAAIDELVRRATAMGGGGEPAAGRSAAGSPFASELHPETGPSKPTVANLPDLFASLKTLCDELHELRGSPRPVDADWHHDKPSLDEAKTQRARCRAAVKGCLALLGAAELPASWLGHDAQASKYIRLKRALDTISRFLHETITLMRFTSFRGFKMPMDSDEQDQHDNPADVREWNEAEAEMCRLGNELKDWIDLQTKKDQSVGPAPRTIPCVLRAPADDESTETATKNRQDHASTHNRDKVFISYSHKDRTLFDEFKTTLAPAIRQGIIDIWDDTRIQPGSQSKAEIAKALAVAKVAVLLISENFLASEFIAKNELPPLLNAAKEKGAVIFWVYLSPCLYKHTEIEPFQSAHDISKPLNQLARAKRQAVWAAICDKLLSVV